MTATERAHEFLVGVLERMGIRAEIEVKEEEERTVLDVKGPEAGLVIGKKGQTLDALQYLVAKVVHRVPGAVGEGDRTARESSEQGDKMVVVDAEGYRARRLEALVEMAHRLGEKAVRSGKTIEVDPMSPHDRRIIHITLDKVPGVTTRSEGEGAYRRLLIIPAPDKQ